jgi:hypothetical protein
LSPAEIAWPPPIRQMQAAPSRDSGRGGVTARSASRITS